MHRESKISVGSTAFLVWILATFFREVFPFSFLGICCFSFVFVYKQHNYTKLFQKVRKVCAEWTSRGNCLKLGCDWMPHQRAQKKHREALGPRIPSNFRSMAHFLRWMCLAFLISPSLISLIQHVSGRQESFLSGEDHCLIVYPSKPTKCRPLREM